MARAFSRGDAAGLIKEHSELLEDLYYASECQERYKNGTEKETARLSGLP